MILRAATVDDLVAIATIQAGAPGSAQWDPTDYLQHDCLVAEAPWYGGPPGPQPASRPVWAARRPPADQEVRRTSIIGFLVTRQTAPGEREILNLVVDSAQRRQGIARALLQQVLAGAPGDWYLEVRQSNAAAMGLYHSLGFQQVGLRTGYYSDPSEPGLVMKLRS